MCQGPRHVTCAWYMLVLNGDLVGWLDAYLNFNLLLGFGFYLAKFPLFILQWFYCSILIPECLSCSKSQENKSSRVSKSSTNANNYGSVPSQSSSVPANNTEDEMDDFDPRGTSTSKYSENTVSNIVVADFIDLFILLFFSFKWNMNYGAHFIVIYVWCPCNFYTFELQAFQAQLIGGRINNRSHH